MNIKLKAALQTIGFFSLGVIAYFLVKAIASVFTVEQLTLAGIGIAVAFITFMMYNVILSHLEYKETIKEIESRRV